MTPVTGDVDKVIAIGHGVGHRNFRVELITQLVEVGNFQLGALIDAAGIGFKLFEQ